MTLQEALEEVKRANKNCHITTFTIFHVDYGKNWSLAIATILNAVVKGELK